MANKIKSKASTTKSIYNPALDKFENVDIFPNKTAYIEKKFKGLNLRDELEKADKKEITKP